MRELENQNTIEVEDLVKRYAGVVAVNNISFSVRRGEIVGFLGPNGAGKSTTMRILTGFLPATSGSVRICGIPVASRPTEVKRRLGYMPENNPLPEDVRISEYLRFRGRIKGLGGSRLRQRVGEVLEICDLKRVHHRIIGKLSKGYRQRIGVADAILSEPELIIMDEPTIGLDPHQIIMIRDLIASLRGRMSVILSSHILPEIEMTCDRVLIINAGRIVASGTPAELRRELIGRSTYRLELAGDCERLPQALGGVAPGLRIESLGEADLEGFRSLTLSSADDGDFGERILRQLPAEGGYRIRALSRSQPSLEDVFLAATRRSWDKVTPLPGENGSQPPFSERQRAEPNRPASS